MPALEHPMAILAVFFAILVTLFVLADQAGLKGFFKYVPPIVFAYFLPATLTTTGILPSASELYDWIKTFLLPVSLFLFTMSLDLKTILRLGWRVIAVMLAGTVGVVLGGPIALVLFSQLLPEDAWQGMAALSGSWIGGGANFVAIAQSVGASDSVLGPIIVADVFGSKTWLGILIFMSVRRDAINRWLRADRSAIDDVQRRIEDFQSSVSRVTEFKDLVVILGMAFMCTWIAYWLGQNLPEVGDFISSGTWRVLAITSFGLLLSFTRFRRYEGAGASKMGNLALYLLITAIGAQADFTGLVEYPFFVVMGLVWIAIHILIIFGVAYLLRAPFFFIAVGSQANIGGAPSASIIAAAFHPSLAPVGILLGILGYVLGTYAGLLCAYLLKMVAGA
ncbi:MAG: DUF819 family protein [Planctomycetota bacterium]|jgi:uncharacterized membrane protein